MIVKHETNEHIDKLTGYYTFTETIEIKFMKADELTEIIKSGNFPKEVNSRLKAQIIELWDSGQTYGAIRKLQTALEKPINNRDKTLL